MRGEPCVARGEQLPCPLGQCRGAARRARVLGRDGRLRCGLEMGRVLVVPAAPQTPQVPDHELRLVIGGVEVRAGQKLFGDLHLVDDRVEPVPRVHQFPRLLAERLQEARGVIQGAVHAFDAHDGHAVPRQQQLRAQLLHAAQGPCPVLGVALHLLGVARVRRVPDEQIAGAQGLELRHPYVGVVVGLPARVDEFEGQLAAVERQPVPVDGVRVAVRGGPLQGGHTELPPVDPRVVAGRPDVAVEAGGHGLVRHHLGACGAGLLRLLVEGEHSEDVIHVPVRIHHGVHRARPEPLDRRVQLRRRTEVARIDEHRAVAGVEDGHVGEGGEEAHPRAQPHQLVPRVGAREMRKQRLRPLPDPVRVGDVVHRLPRGRLRYGVVLGHGRGSSG